MARHTAPQKRHIDDAFPIRIKIRIPPRGLGNLTNDINRWIRDHLGPEQCRNQSTRATHCQATAFYFRSMADAQAFLDAFPMLELADGIDLASSNEAED